MAKIDWQPIETFPPAGLPYTEAEFSGEVVRFYEGVLIYGPTWAGDFNDNPYDGSDYWTGDPVIAVGDTHSPAVVWSLPSSAPSGYETYVRPTHYAVVSAPDEG